MVKNRTPAGGAREVTGPRSLTRVLGLFDVLAKSKEGLSLADLNTALRSPKSSLLNLLRPLVADGYLNYENGRYRLGASIFRLAGSILSVWNFSSAFRPYLQELAQLSQESVYMGVLDRAGKCITYVDAIESPQSVRFTVPVGAVRPLYSTAAGRVLLAFVEPAWRDEYIGSLKLQAFTPTTITSRTALREELERIRETRVSVSLGETFAESAAISSPVFGSDGKIVGAIAIGAPINRLEPRLAELKPLIIDLAARCSGSARRSVTDSATAAEPPKPVTRKRAGSSRAETRAPSSAR